MTRRLAAWLVAVALLAAPAVACAQTGPVAQAERALGAGDFARVEALVGGSDAPRAEVLLALADAGRGRYAAAEARLAAAASADPTGDAALELGLLKYRLGRRTDARLDLRGLINRSSPATAADFVRLGRAARALRQFDAANTYFRRANTAAPGDPLVNTEWGLLFLEQHQNQEAFDSFQIALDGDEAFVPALVGMVRVFQQDNPPQAQDFLARAREANADNIAVLLIEAEVALDNRDRDAAGQRIARAKAVNPNSLEAHALAAALASLEGRNADFEAEAAAALAVNPVYGEVYRVAGDHAARNYLFTEAVALTRRALAVDPENTTAYANLGMHLLRTGDEAGARQALERAFADDPYDTVTFNSLAMLDALDTFVTLEEGDIVLRLAPDEAGVLREFAMPLAQEALATLSSRYGFRPAGPILVEVFPRHDDFAVRTLGLPGFLGALGACFGSVVTMDSPNARTPGTFSWEATLWHEMAHVITLQMSNNRIPRWLSEGASVFEERRGRPEWGRETLVTFVQAMAAGRLIPLADITAAFSDPETINLAYFQSSVVVDFVVDTYGEPMFHAMVRAYGDRLETEEVVQEVLGLSMDAFQDGFTAYVNRTYGTLAESLRRPDGVDGDESRLELEGLVELNPRSFGLRVLLARALREEGDTDGAIAQLEEAARLVPQAGGGANPNALIAQIAIDEGDLGRAVDALEAVVRVDHYDVNAARQLVELADRAGDGAALRSALARVVATDPFDGAALQRHGRLQFAAGEVEAATQAFRAVLAAGPPNLAEAHADLGEALLEADDTAGAKVQVLAALEAAPAFERAQDLLLAIIDREIAAP